MTLGELKKLFEDNDVNELSWNGACHDCGKSIEIIAQLAPTGEIFISGGAVYNAIMPDHEEAFFGKCDECFKKDSDLRGYQPAEVYSRVVGYLRPIKQWNPGKQAEFYKRKVFEPEELREIANG